MRKNVLYVLVAFVMAQVITASIGLTTASEAVERMYFMACALLTVALLDWLDSRSAK